jgi:hypothetical protein
MQTQRLNVLFFHRLSFLTLAGWFVRGLAESLTLALSLRERELAPKYPCPSLKKSPFYATTDILQGDIPKFLFPLP